MMRLAIATVLGVALEEWGLGFISGIGAGSIGPRMLLVRKLFLVGLKAIVEQMP
jgi:hypothetical protein